MTSLDNYVPTNSGQSSQSDTVNSLVSRLKLAASAVSKSDGSKPPVLVLFNPAGASALW